MPGPVLVPGYAPVADNEAFSRARFAAAPWFNWARNGQHLVGDRCHLLIKTTVTRSADVGTAALAEAFRVVVRRTPECRVLFTQVGITRSRLGDAQAGSRLSLRVDTGDTAGAGHDQNGDSTTTFVPEPFGEVGAGMRASRRRWFLGRDLGSGQLGRYAPQHVCFSPWLRSTLHSAIGDDIVIKLMAQKVASGLLVGGDPNFRVVSLTCVGFREPG